MIFDMIGTHDARTNGTGQSKWAKAAAATSGMGLFELNIGRNGVSGKISSGGINIGGNLYTLGKRMEDKKNLEAFRAGNDKNVGDAAWYSYVYGDWTQENTAARLASGLDQLEFVSGEGKAEGWTAQTTSNGRGGRNIQMLDSGDYHTNAIQLGHEAYRNGITGNEAEQKAETIAAVMGHAGMAGRMMGYEGNKIGGLYGIEGALYNQGQFGLLNMIADGMYDSSADYWKLMDDGRLVNDGSGWLTDEHGVAILNAEGKKIGSGSGIEAGLLNILFGKSSKGEHDGSSGRSYSSFSEEEQFISYMILKGSKFENDDPDMMKKIQDIKWTENTKKELDMDLVMRFAGNTVASSVFARYYDSAVDAKYATEKKLDVKIENTHVARANVSERFDELYKAKSQFYDDAGSFVDLSKNYYISGAYNTEYDGHYSYYNYKHYGFDLGRAGGSGGDDLIVGISGRVTDKNWNEANGNCLQIQYGYNFESTFVGTGIYGEYLHMQEKSTLSKEDFIDSKYKIGTIGGTGYGKSNYYADHLHYDILTFGNSYKSNSTLTILLGDKKNWGPTVSSKDNYKNTYNPNLYYKNFLKNELKLQEELTK